MDFWFWFVILNMGFTFLDLFTTAALEPNMSMIQFLARTLIIRPIVFGIILIIIKGALLIINA